MRVTCLKYKSILISPNLIIDPKDAGVAGYLETLKTKKILVQLNVLKFMHFWFRKDFTKNDIMECVESQVYVTFNLIFIFMYYINSKEMLLSFLHFVIVTYDSGAKKIANVLLVFINMTFPIHSK